MSALLLYAAALSACVADPPTRHPAADRDTGHDTGGDTGDDSGDDSGAIDPDAELWIVQIDIDSLALGEAALVIGPDGRSLLIDVGNDSHAAAVEAAVDRYLGHAPDHVVLTHHHADHIGAIDELSFVPQGSLYWRGDVDLVEDSNAAEVAEVQAVGWPEVRVGGWASGPVEIDLGGGAVVRLLAVDGRSHDGQMCSVGDDENARSLLGTLSWGDFDYVFAGDLTGGGKDTPDCEAAYLGTELLPEADLLHLGHHGIDSATSDAWLDRVFPAGTTRNALVGANVAYGWAPDQAVIDRVVPHLGDGRLWVTRKGAFAGDDAKVVEAQGDVLVRVHGAATYAIEGGESATFAVVR